LLDWLLDWRPDNKYEISAVFLSQELQFGPGSVREAVLCQAQSSWFSKEFGNFSKIA